MLSLMVQIDSAFFPHLMALAYKALAAEVMKR